MGLRQPELISEEYKGRFPLNKGTRKKDPVKDFEFISGQRDLQQAQIEVTDAAYNVNAIAYSLVYERNETARQRSIEVMLQPLFKHMSNRYDYMRKAGELVPDQEHQSKGRILFVGSGTGRDLEIADSQGYGVFGIDKSSAMVNIASASFAAQEIGNQAPLAVMDMLNLELDQEFDGVMCESAFSHVKKPDVADFLDTVYDYMTPGGIALFGFRGSEAGEVYRTEDQVGIRYYTSHTPEELEKLFKRSQFDVIEVTTTPHMVKGRPNHVNYWVRKAGQKP